MWSKKCSVVFFQFVYKYGFVYLQNENGRKYKIQLAQRLPLVLYGVRIISNTHFLAPEMRFSLNAGYENIETESDLAHTEI